MINHPNRSKRSKDDGNPKIGLRVIASVLSVLIYGWINFLLNPVATIGAGRMAAGQFEPSDSAYVISQFGMAFFSNFGVPVLVLVAVLFVIWWKPAKTLLVSLMALTLIAAITSQPASAYYDKSDYTEPYFILPNESAFWIPDVGDNKTSQAKFGSEDYFRSNKIAAKRFIIPHTKLEGSGLWSNFYVPSGRLIIVERTPYSREWVDAQDRGTAARKQGFPCQSKEGLNITVGIAIGTSISEDDAPKFLYRFGINPPPGNRTDPVVLFTSVLQSRSLVQVMDSVGRNKVQALVCNEIGSRTFDNANIEATKIMENVRKDAGTYFATVGITLDYLGWADTMTFDPAVQKAVNDRYVAEKIAPVMATLTQNANNRVLEGLGTGLATHGLPANLVAIPEHLLELQKLFAGGSK